MWENVTYCAWHPKSALEDGIWAVHCRTTGTSLGCTVGTVKLGLGPCGQRVETTRQHHRKALVSPKQSAPFRISGAIATHSSLDLSKPHSFLCVLCMCVCTCVCRDVPPCKHMWRPTVNARLFLYCSRSYILRQALSLNLALTGRLDWLVGKLAGPPIPLPSAV